MMKIIFLPILFFTSSILAETVTGRTLMGPATIKSRDTSKSIKSPQMPEPTPATKQKQEEKIPAGPYKNGEYQFFDKNNRDSDQVQ